MAQETLTSQEATRAGGEVALQSITTADGFKFPNNGRTFLYIENDVGDLVVAFTFQKTIDGKTPAAKSVTVTASKNWVIGPFPTEIYNDSDGNVVCTVDADLASATAVVKFP